MIDYHDFSRLTDVEWRTHDEAQRGIFVAEGRTTIGRALSAGYVLRSAISTQRWQAGLLELGVPPTQLTVVSEQEMETLTGFHVHRGALAAFERPLDLPTAELLNTSRALIVVEDVVDHANVGAIMRSAAGFGIDGVLLTPRCADPLYRRAVKVSMGTVFSIRWTRIGWPSGLTQLHDAGFISIALTPDASAMDLRELPAEVRSGKWALLLGTEGDGLHAKTLRDASIRSRIAMAPGVDSLNVAAATAVACFALTR